MVKMFVIAISVATVLVLVLYVLLSVPRGHTVYPRNNAEVKIGLGLFPDTRMMVVFNFPKTSAVDVNLLRSDIRASIIPDGFGSVSHYERGDVYPNDENSSYAMFEVSTRSVRPHFLKLYFLKPEKWPEEVTVTINSVGL